MKIGPTLYDPRTGKHGAPPPAPPTHLPPQEGEREGGSNVYAKPEPPLPRADDWGAPGPLESEYGFSWPIDLGTWRDFNVRAEWRNDEPGGETLWLRLPWVGPIRVPFHGEKVVWTLVKREPLTVRPSIKVLFGDGVDRLHGFITEGRWVSTV